MSVPGNRSADVVPWLLLRALNLRRTLTSRQSLRRATQTPATGSPSGQRLFAKNSPLA